MKEKETINELQEKAELTIFSVYQKQVDNYIQSFQGSGFYTWKADEVTYVRGRDTYVGETKYLLCPPKTLLYSKICQTFHEKYHQISASPAYIRSQLLTVRFISPTQSKHSKVCRTNVLCVEEE